ncbi:MAG: PKD domain-containing protein [Cyclobacteriaceae bacterium]
MKFLISVWVWLLLPFGTLYCQCPAGDFILPTNACNQELLLIENLPNSAITQTWDFCSGDLSNLPQAQASYVLSGVNGLPGIELIKDGNIWYGFVTGTYANILYRLEFANGINSPPTLTENLGNLSGKLNSPGQVRIIQEGNLWYGFIHNTTSGELLQLNFGGSLSNSFTVSTVFSGMGYSFSGLAFGKDPIDGWICIISTASNQFKIIRLGNTFITPGPSDILTSSTVPNQNNLGDVDLINICGLWYGFADNFGNGNIYRLDFGSNIFSEPTITQLTTLGVSNPGRLRIAKDGDEYYVFVIALDGTLTKLELGADINSSPVIITEGNIGNVLEPNTYGLALAKENSEWMILTVDQSNGQVYKIMYPNSCTAIPEVSNQVNPEVKYTQSGVYNVSLESTYASGTSVRTKSITVSSALAPDLDFVFTNMCANNDVNFTSDNMSGDITDYNWDFDDTNTSIVQDPIHQFAAAGDYEVKLQVTAANGCNNLASETVTIYNEPVADFDLPSASPICTNQDYLFTNTTSFDPGSNPSWQWEVNGTPTSSTQDLTYEIPTATMQDIKLIASIPGCSSEVTKTINTVEDGPLADFSFANDCEDKSITFTNTTVGTVTGYSWDFGDGNFSGLTDGTNTFGDFGTYDVTQEATNAAGCINTSVQEITIYSKPQPDFSLDLPPFSCNGSPSQFNDLTPNSVDSNLESWVWSFGDTQSGTSAVRNPQYIYTDAGQYNVNLDVTTNFGCTTSVQKMVTISQSPDASFTFNAACVNQATSFVPQSPSGIDSWQWKVGVSTYNQQNPTHVFSTPSNYNVQLTANGSNGCIGVASQTINVPAPSTVDFDFENNCTNQDTQFTDLTLPTADPVASRTWQFGTIGSASGATPSLTFPTAGSYPTKLTVTNESGCSYSTTKIVNITQSPVATFTATPQTGTPPLIVQLNNTSANSISQLWSVNDSNNTTSTEETASFTFDKLGEFVVDLTIEDETGCTSVSSKIISVIIPTLDIELTHISLIPATTGESNILLSLTNKSNFPVNNIKAVIDIAGEALISETLTATIQPGEVYSQILSSGIVGSKNGTTYLCVELVVDGDANTTNNKKCLNNDAATEVIAPYPNPGSEILNLEWISAASTSAEIHIFDPTGRKVFEDIFFNLEPGLNQATISVSLLNPGMYYVFFVSEGVRRSFPFVIRR